LTPLKSYYARVVDDEDKRSAIRGKLDQYRWKTTFSSIIVAGLFATALFQIFAPATYHQQRSTDAPGALIIANKLDLNTRDNRGHTLLMRAVIARNYADVKKLLDGGADVNAKDDLGFTALMMAADSGSSEILTLLVERGADLNAKDNYDKTALIWAAEDRQNRSISQLLAYGADINARDRSGWHALMHAANLGYADIVDNLLAHGAAVNLQDKNGWTTLMYIVKTSYIDNTGRANLIQALKNSNADLSLKNNEGKTAFMLASDDGNETISQLLLILR
jgi:ankyrin repeat protein